jgi:MFS family permease
MRVRALSAAGPGEAVSARGYAPLFILAGSHGSLHWAVATFYFMLPFIKESFDLTYTQTGLFATIIHASSFIANIPSGMIVDVTGRRRACQIVALALAAVGMVGIGWASAYWLIACFVALVAMMNTLWHPAAISFLSTAYADRRGLALSFHTVGASLGDAAAPLCAGVLVAAFGWPGATMSSAVVPLAAAVLLFLVPARMGVGDDAKRSGGGVRNYLLDLSMLFGRLEIWKICLMSGFRGTSQTGLRTFLPLYFFAAFTEDPLWMGVLLSVLQASGAVATPFAGAISDRIGRKPVLLIGFLGSAAVIVALPWIGSLWVLMAVVGLGGVFVFAVRPVIQSWALDMTPPRLAGSMVSLQFGTQSAFAMAVPIGGGMIADRWGIEYVFYALAGATVIAIAIAGSISEAADPPD